jgi:hypothetical protein
MGPLYSVLHQHNNFIKLLKITIWRVGKPEVVTLYFPLCFRSIHIEKLFLMLTMLPRSLAAKRCKGRL